MLTEARVADAPCLCLPRRSIWRGRLRLAAREPRPRSGRHRRGESWRTRFMICGGVCPPMAPSAFVGMLQLASQEGKEAPTMLSLTSPHICPESRGRPGPPGALGEAGPATADGAGRRGASPRPLPALRSHRGAAGAAERCRTVACDDPLPSHALPGSQSATRTRVTHVCAMRLSDFPSVLDHNAGAIVSSRIGAMTSLHTQQRLPRCAPRRLSSAWAAGRALG